MHHMIIYDVGTTWGHIYRAIPCLALPLTMYGDVNWINRACLTNATLALCLTRNAI